MSAIIRREAFAACAEGQALPGGEYVVALNEPAVLTDARRIPCPEPLRFPVMTVGTGRGRCIAGQSQVSLATWEYVEAEDRWFDRGPNAGERPVLFLPDGTLVIERGGPDHPTEGWAGTSLDGQPVRIVRADHARDLYEVTEIGPFAVGQLPDGGIGLLFDGKRYLVESGDVHTPWFVLGANGVLAIAARKLAQNETVLLWVDANRIAELPAAPTTEPPVIVPPIDPPIIVPPKEPVMHVPNRGNLLAQFHQEFNGGQPINELAEKHRFTAAFVPWINAHEPDADAKGRYARKSRESSPDIVSKDTIAFWLGPKPVPTENTNGVVDAVDIIGSDGGVSWDTRAEKDDPAYHEIRALWMPIAGAVEPPVVVPPVDDDLAAQVKALTEQFSAFGGRLAAVERVGDASVAQLKVSAQREADFETRIKALEKPGTGGATGGTPVPADLAKQIAAELFKLFSKLGQAA